MSSSFGHAKWKPRFAGLVSVLFVLGSNVTFPMRQLDTRHIFEGEKTSLGPQSSSTLIARVCFVARLVACETGDRYHVVRVQTRTRTSWPPQSYQIQC